MAYKDPIKQKEFQRDWFQKNKLKIKPKAKKNYKKSLERNKKFIRELKESIACKDCGMKYHWCVMDFDHLSDKKMRFSVDGCTFLQYKVFTVGNS